MKKLFQLTGLLLWAVISLTLTACGDEYFGAEEATLEVSTTQLAFANNGGQQTLTIQTNQDKWVASSPEECSWLTISQNGNTLNAIAQTNTEGVERKGYILIQAGGAVEKVTVSQSAGDAYIQVDCPDEVELPMLGGQQHICVKSNYPVSSVEVVGEETGWLQVETAEGWEHFTLSCGENRSYPRPAKVYVHAGDAAYELAVTQKGHDLIPMPILEGNLSFVDVQRAEAARGSVISAQAISDDEYYLFEYTTTHPEYPAMTYVYQFTDDDFYTQAFTFISDKWELGPDTPVDRELVGKGFQRINDKFYTHTTYPLWLRIHGTYFGDYYCEYTWRNLQTESYPTTAQLELKDKWDWLAYGSADPANGSHGWKSEQLQAWCEAKGYTYDDQDLETYNRLSVSGLDHPDVLSYGAWVYSQADVEKGLDPSFLGEIHAVQAVYEDYHRLLYFDGPVENGDWYVTREMDQLLYDNGFELVAVAYNAYLYLNSSEGIVYAVRPIGEQLEDGTWLIQADHQVWRTKKAPETPSADASFEEMEQAMKAKAIEFVKNCSAARRQDAPVVPWQSVRQNLQVKP